MHNPDDPLGSAALRQLRLRVEKEIGDFDWVELIEEDPTFFSPDQRLLVIEVGRVLQQRFELELNAPLSPTRFSDVASLGGKPG